jgi:chemotaxis response regulator CheB
MSIRARKVLIVDDSESSRLNLEDVFNNVGMEVVGFAADGVQALAAIEQLKPDLVSLDVIMPNMDGIEAYRTILKRFPDVKCLIVSILCNEQKFRDAYRDEIPEGRFVAKPVDTAQLESILAEMFTLQGQ